MKDERKGSEETARKVYSEPTLEKTQKLQNVTEGPVPVVTGAVAP